MYLSLTSFRSERKAVMIEIITGLVLAAAAGLNAYVPLLGMGLLARFTPLLNLPENWTWLTSDWVLILLAVLLLIEFLVDKFPVLDTVNDVVQTVIRPASGGIVFAAGTSSETVAITDPSSLFDGATLWPIVIGVAVALVPHLLKAIVRPALNTMTGGAAAPIASVTEDFGAVLLTILAVVIPVVALLLLVGIIWWLLRRLAGLHKRRREAREVS